MLELFSATWGSWCCCWEVVMAMVELWFDNMVEDDVCVCVCAGKLCLNGQARKIVRAISTVLRPHIPTSQRIHKGKVSRCLKSLQPWCQRGLVASQRNIVNVWS